MFAEVLPMNVYSQSPHFDDGYVRLRLIASQSIPQMVQLEEKGIA